MRRRNNDLISINKNGEMLYENLNEHTDIKNSPDNVFDREWVSFVILMICAASDVALILGIFAYISSDNIFLQIIGVAGFIFCLDILPIFIGMEVRRIKEGLSKNRSSVWIALAVFFFAIALNATLRVTTMDNLAPADDDEGYSYANAEQLRDDASESAENKKTSGAAISLTIFGAVMPLLTSAGSYMVSSATYHPFKIRKRKLEKALNFKADEIRRFKAVIAEYEADKEHYAELMTDDRLRYDAMKQIINSKVLSYCSYCRLRLAEHLADPAATNALSKDNCEDLIKRLDKQIAILRQSALSDLLADPPVSVSNTDSELLHDSESDEHDHERSVGENITNINNGNAAA